MSLLFKICTEHYVNVHLIESHDVGMVQQLHHLHLPVHLGEVGRVQLGLVDDFDGDLKYFNSLQTKNSNHSLLCSEGGHRRA